MDQFAIKNDEKNISSKSIKLQFCGIGQFWRIFAIAALLSFLIVGYLNALKNRYHSFDDGTLVLDTWTGKAYDTDDMISSLSK